MTKIILDGITPIGATQIPTNPDRDGKGDLISNPYEKNEIKPLPENPTWDSSDNVNLIKKMFDGLTLDIFLGKFGIKSIVAIIVVAIYVIGSIFKVW